MNPTRTLTALTATLGAGLALLTSGQLHAQAAAQEFVPFNQFMDGTRAMAADAALRPAGPNRREAARDEMREHVLKTYRGVLVSHSFVMGSSHFDCVPTLQQPTTRAFGIDQVAPAPPQSLLAPAVAVDDPAAEGPTRPALMADGDDRSDEFGNSLRCEDGTIPMRRLTVEDLGRFPTLEEAFHKGPDSAGQAVPAADLGSHKYSRMYQIVNNLGGSSNLNVWSPYVDTARGEVFSLSQEWYLGGTGNGLQTVEVGWQNYPQLYGNQKSRLFIYWTADAYTSTGCYNLDCPAFVQTNSSIALGSDFGSSYSTLGGNQYDISAQYYLYQGNWWLSIQGTWIGYYPGSIFRGGQLTRYAEQVQFGTESTGATVWPGEGSGEFATSGYGRSAFQRNLYHYSTSGTATWNTLTQWISSPTCYNVAGPFSSKTAGWNVYFYEGGPGGTNCQ